MQHTGTLYLSKTKPEIAEHEGQFALLLLLMDNLGKQGLEPYRVRWTGPEAQAFWASHKGDLTPGAALDVELSNVRAMSGATRPPMPELRARVARMRLRPRRTGADAAQQPTTSTEARAMAAHLRASTTYDTVIVAKQLIEQQAHEAVRKGKSLNDACPYPFTSEAGHHFTATFLIAQRAAQAAQEFAAQPA